jgi:hypothetical protein
MEQPVLERVQGWQASAIVRTARRRALADAIAASRREERLTFLAPLRLERLRALAQR